MANWQLPENVGMMLKDNINDDRYSMSGNSGVVDILILMWFEKRTRRTKGKSQMNLAIEDLEIYYEVLENDFQLFFKELQEFVLLEIKKNSLF